MKQKIQLILATFAMVVGIGAMTAAPVGAINVFGGCSGTAANTEVCKAKSDSVDEPVKVVINTLLWAIGVVSVIMIIIGGIKYTMSNGDSSQIASAKNTILYAVIGLVVAMLAYAIVNFVVTRFA